MNKFNNYDTLNHYRGRVWISKLFDTEMRGNVCFLGGDNDFHVIAYLSPDDVARAGGLESAVNSSAVAQGLFWTLQEARP